MTPNDKRPIIETDQTAGHGSAETQADQSFTAKTRYHNAETSNQPASG